jgi:hypothetical protein
MRAVRTWAKDAAEEDAMNDDHDHLWRQLIRHLQEDSLAGKAVLDYGCNQGGFLRLLLEMKPFRHGTGTVSRWNRLPLHARGLLACRWISCVWRT